MTVFHTSDPHIGHRFVAKLRWQRAFPGLELPSDEKVVSWHDQVLAQHWDNTVKKDDVVWVHGDLALTNAKAGVNHVLDWVTNRHGRKQLIFGNHDPGHPMHRDSYKWQKEYLRHAFESAQLAARRKVTLKDGSTRSVLLSHMPYQGDRTESDRDVQWRLRDEGLWLWHGHLHSEFTLHAPGTKQLDVGVDAWGLKPVAEETLIGLISSYEGALAL
jgi:calcineurin-like phosphoesterase family protein